MTIFVCLCKNLTKMKELGIAFGGGGARACAQCGAVQALREYGVKPDIVSGTSAGAIMAVLYSAGLSSQQLVDLFEGLDFFKDIVTPEVPRGGMFSSAPLLALLRSILPYKNLEDLPVTTYVVASDLEKGCVKIFKEGEIAPRVVASCSIPIIFTPIKIDGAHYVDGGVFQNLPVPAIREECRKVISFSLLHLEDEKYHDNLISVANRSFNMILASNELADMRLSDLDVKLDTSGCNAYDLSKLEILFKRGYRQTCEMLEEQGYRRVLEPETIVFKQKEEDKMEKLHSIRPLKEAIARLNR